MGSVIAVSARKQTHTVFVSDDCGNASHCHCHSESQTDHWSHSSYEHALDPAKAAHLPFKTEGPEVRAESQPDVVAHPTSPSSLPGPEALGVDEVDNNGLAGVAVADPLQVSS